MKFLDGLDNDIKQNLLAQLRNLWTHTSTAIEGNTLTLGETAFVIEEGLTVSGKPLKDHEEVVGHAKAIDLIYELVKQSKEILEQDLFKIHKAIQTERVADIYKPVSGWKVEPNGTYAVGESGKQVFLDYAEPEDVPVLMKKWLKRLNEFSANLIDRQALISVYTELHISFVRMHPFFDGNGRLARLLANMPVLKSGYPPIIIEKEKRQQYIRILSAYELAVGQPELKGELLPEHELLEEYKRLCSEGWEQSFQLIEEAKKTMSKRF